MGGEICMAIKILLITLLVEVPLVIFYYQRELRRREREKNIRNAAIADFVAEKLIEEILTMLKVCAGSDIDFNCQVAVWQEKYNNMVFRNMDIVAIIMHLVSVISSYEKIESKQEIKDLFESIQCFISSLVMKKREDYRDILDEFLNLFKNIQDKAIKMKR